MKKTAGFTLIELVIVIVILGILGAVAAPKFLNLQDDAYGANINALKGSIQSAATLANTKAILDGKDSSSDTGVTGYPGVQFVFGYPEAASGSTGIFGALQSVPSEDDFTFSVASGALSIQPKARATDSNKCYVKYTEATSNASAIIESNNEC